jgi:hypothetical protein
MKAILRKQEVSVGIGAIYIGCFFKFHLIGGEESIVKALYRLRITD